MYSRSTLSHLDAVSAVELFEEGKPDLTKILSAH